MKMTMTSETMNTSDLSTTDKTTASIARKRRIELRNQQRNVSDDSSDDGHKRGKKRVIEDFDDDDDDDYSLDPVTLKPRPSITGIKRQSRYDPGVPMTRDELTVWRKEARRVRNRESAAESRKRNRARISELEIEVDVLKSRYSTALQRIVELEAAAAVNDSFVPLILRQDVEAFVTPSSSEAGSTPSSPRHSSFASPTISPPMTPTQSLSRLPDSKYHEEISKKVQHIKDMIIRPLA
jgi:bZIP transcription factor